MQKKIRLVSIGDCCADIYAELDKVFPGGTAFNVAAQAHQTGADTSILSAIGTDFYADLLQKACRSFHIDTSHLRMVAGKTSHITVKLDDDGKPGFSHWELGVLKKYLLNQSDIRFIHTHDIARIVLFKPMASLFEQFCAIKKLAPTLKVADFSGSDMYSEAIGIIESHIENLDIIVKSLDEKNKGALNFLQKLAARYKDKVVLVLLGKNGSMAFAEGNIYKQPAIATHIKDTNGAGDAYVSRFLVSFVSTGSIPLSMREGAKAAAKTISYIGAVKKT